MQKNAKILVLLAPPKTQNFRAPAARVLTFPYAPNPKFSRAYGALSYNGSGGKHNETALLTSPSIVDNHGKIKLIHSITIFIFFIKSFWCIFSNQNDFMKNENDNTLIL